MKFEKRDGSQRLKCNTSTQTNREIKFFEYFLEQRAHKLEVPAGVTENTPARTRPHFAKTVERIFLALDRGAKRRSQNMKQHPHEQTSERQIDELMDSAASGCEDAAIELVRRFDSQIRMEARSRLHHAPQTRRLHDSTDIAQSVFLRFFQGLRNRTIDWRCSRQTNSLLRTICRNKVKEKIRMHRAACRDQRRERPLNDSTEPFFAPTTADDTSASVDESSCTTQVNQLLESLGNGNQSPESKIMQLRADGYTWAEIAERVGLSADACRMRLERVRVKWFSGPTS